MNLITIEFIRQTWIKSNSAWKMVKIVEMFAQTLDLVSQVNSLLEI